MVQRGDVFVQGQAPHTHPADPLMIKRVTLKRDVSNNSTNEQSFVQMWSVHAFLRQGDIVKQVPLLFVLMSRRRKVDYVAVLTKIQDVLEEGPMVESFTMDFEAGKLTQ